jgi:hypothetical protein
MDKIILTLKLSHEEASSLALLCRQFDWDALTSYSSDRDECIHMRYALAALRFSLTDAGYVANVPSEKE